MPKTELIRGNCVEVMKSFSDEVIDLTVTSPPYDNLRSYNGNNEQWDERVWKDVIKELYRVTKRGGVVVWVVGDATIKGSETGTSFKQALFAKDCGFRLHDTMIWLKPNPMPRTHNRYEQAFEYMFVFSKGRPKTWNPKMIACKMAGKKRGGTFQHNGDGVRLPKHKGGVCAKTKQADNVWVCAGGSKTKHPAEFPEALITDHILSWSNEVDTVFDPFMGSGTTGKIAKQLNRDFIGIELDENYFAIAKKRIKEA
jgi:site-specific DNA-methyltransferase (adenine-specific)